MSGYLWDQPGVPHLGWACTGVVDSREDESPGDEPSYYDCEMCGNEKVRWVHLMRHAEYATQLRVGCECAVKMSGDRVGVTKREKDARNRAKRLEKWLNEAWKPSAQGCYRFAKHYKFGVKRVGERLWEPWIVRAQNFVPIRRSTHASEREAKAALFDAYEKLAR